jgi:hypothetical protein
MSVINQELFLEHVRHEALFIKDAYGEENQWEELYQAIELLLSDCGINSSQFDDYDEFNSIVVSITDEAFKSIKVKFLPRMALINAINLLEDCVVEHKGNVDLYNQMKDALKE